MDKRLLATALWFLAGWAVGAHTAAFLGMPSVIAFVPGVVAAIIIFWDPTNVLWSRLAAKSRVTSINDLAESLGRDGGPTGAGQDHART